MDSKRPFARVAARTSAGFAVGAIALFTAILLRSALPPMSEVYAQAFLSLCAVGVCACLLASLSLGAMALCGVKKHGKTGILAPAMVGLVMSGLMLISIIVTTSASRVAQAREASRPPAATNQNPLPR